MLRKVSAERGDDDDGDGDSGSKRGRQLEWLAVGGLCVGPALNAAADALQMCVAVFSGIERVFGTRAVAAAVAARYRRLAGRALRRERGGG